MCKYITTALLVAAGEVTQHTATKCPDSQNLPTYKEFGGQLKMRGGER